MYSVAVQRQVDLLQVILALRTCSGFADPSGGRNKQRDDHRDQRKHDQDIDDASHWVDRSLFH